MGRIKGWKKVSDLKYISNRGTELYLDSIDDFWDIIVYNKGQDDDGNIIASFNTKVGARKLAVDFMKKNR